MESQESRRDLGVHIKNTINRLQDATNSEQLKDFHRVETGGEEFDPGQAVISIWPYIPGRLVSVVEHPPGIFRIEDNAEQYWYPDVTHVDRSGRSITSLEQMYRFYRYGSLPSIDRPINQEWQTVVALHQRVTESLLKPDLDPVPVLHTECVIDDDSQVNWLQTRLWRNSSTAVEPDRIIKREVAEAGLENDTDSFFPAGGCQVVGNTDSSGKLVRLYLEQPPVTDHDQQLPVGIVHQSSHHRPLPVPPNVSAAVVGHTMMLEHGNFGMLRKVDVGLMVPRVRVLRLDHPDTEQSGLATIAQRPVLARIFSNGLQGAAVIIDEE